MTTVVRNGVLVSLRRGTQELVMTELPASHAALTSHFTYSYCQACKGGTQLLLTPEPSSGQGEDGFFRKFDCVCDDDECTTPPLRMNVLLYNHTNLSDSLTNDNKEGCQCFGAANQGIRNNHILVRLPKDYVSYLRSNQLISEDTYSRYGTFGTTSNLLAFVPVPLLETVSTLTGSTVQVPGYQTLPLPPPFTDEIIGSLRLLNNIKFSLNDSLFTVEEIQRLTLISSVENSQGIIEGGLWVIDVLQASVLTP